MSKHYELTFADGQCMQIEGRNIVCALASYARVIHHGHSYADIVLIRYLGEFER